MSRLELSSTPKVTKPKKKEHGSNLLFTDPLAYLQDHLSAALVEASECNFPSPPSHREFRTSGLPFCPIKTFLGEPRTENYRMNHYTSIGTAMHTNIQSWLSLTKQSAKDMFGSWKCTSCGKVLLNRKLPSKPCDCTGKMSVTDFHRRWPKFWCYEEIEYNYRGLSGHIDLVMAPHPEFYYVVDFKTANLTKKKSSVFWKADAPSSPSYIAQIRTYCTVLDLAFDLPIRGWALTSLDRAEPIKTANDFHMVPSLWSHEKSLKWDKQLARSSKNFTRLLELDEYVENGERKAAKKSLRGIVENRPCVDQKSYQSYMGYAFFGKTECSLKKDCLSCDSDRILSSIYKQLSEKE